MRRLCFALLVLAACGDDGNSANDAAVDGRPLTDATSLHCPAAGDLPFRLASSGFAVANNATLAADNPRNKDEASDTIGNPGGSLASVYLADGASVGTSLEYQGAKARTTPTGGLFAKALVGEKVSLWFYDTTARAWQAKGSTTTDFAGSYVIPSAGFTAPNGQPLYAMLEADGTCAEHFNYLYPANTKVVVTDIDGTLTSDDQQIINQETMESYTPILMTAGEKLTKAWADKGYPVIYLTARVHNLRGDTRAWLDAKGFAPGPVITFNGGGSGADAYKTLWLSRMITTFHWNVVAAYGNADTDITAYNNAAIPKAQTFIVGPLAGSMGTQAIANMDYTSHISTYVAAQPAP